MCIVCSRVARRRISIHSCSASNSAMWSKSLGVEVGVELAVEDVQDVAVELGRDALRCRRRPPRARPVLDEVGPEQQVVLGTEQPRRSRAASAGGCRAGSCRSCRRASATIAAARRPRARASRWRSKSPITPCTRSPGTPRRASPPQSRDHALGDVERDVALQRAGGRQRVEQHARLVGRAGAELDELDRRRSARDDLPGAVCSRIARSVRVG